MEWQTIASIFAVIATTTLGIVTLFRGVKADTALNTATMVQSVYVAQQHLIDDLQQRVTRMAELLAACEARDKDKDRRIQQLERRMNGIEASDE